MGIWKRLMSLVTVFIVGAVAAGCGNTPATVAHSDVLRTAFTEDVGTIDPDNNFEVAGLGMILSIYQGLLHYKPGTTQIEGLLASSWTASPDYTKFTFTLRTGVKFHDGTTMTSDSVKAAFERRIKHQDLATGYFLGGVKSIDTPDPQTVVITLSSSDYSFLDGLCSPCGPKVVGPLALTTNAGSDYSKTWLNLNADGTGPYKLTTFTRGTEYVLTRFDDYWGQRPDFKEIDIHIVPDLGQQILELRNGQLDFVDNYPYSQVSSVSSGLKVLSWNTVGMELAIVNTNRVTNKNARLRIAAAINPSQWVSQAFGNYGAPAQSNYAASMLAPATPWTWPTAPDSTTPVPALSIAYASNDVAFQSQIANFLIADLQKVGITATARVMPTDQFNNTAKDPAHGPDISLVHFYPDDAFPGSITYLVYQCGTPLNYLGYCNHQADALFGAGFGTADPAQRAQDFLNGAKFGFDDAAFLGLTDVQDVIVYRQGLANLVTYPTLPWNFDYGLVRNG